MKKLIFITGLFLICISAFSQQPNNFRYRWTSKQIFDSLFIPKGCGPTTPVAGTGAHLYFDSCNNVLYANGEVVSGSVSVGNTCYRDILIDTSFFTDANTCVDTSIKGSIYAIYWEDVPAFLESTDYDTITNGFEITISDFDATANAYQFHVYTIDTTGGCSNGTGGGGGGGGGSSYSFTSPLNNTSGTVSINNAVADGSTKGVSSYNANDFNTSAGNVTIDYPNAQKANNSVPGLMTASDHALLGRLKTVQSLTDGATITMNIANGNHGTVTISGDRNFTISNLESGDEGWIIVIQDATGGRDLTFPAGTQITNGYGSGVVPELSTAAGKKDLVNFLSDGTRIIITSVIRDIQ